MIDWHYYISQIEWKWDENLLVALFKQKIQRLIGIVTLVVE